MITNNYFKNCKAFISAMISRKKNNNLEDSWYKYDFSWRFWWIESDVDS